MPLRSFPDIRQIIELKVQHAYYEKGYLPSNFKYIKKRFYDMKLQHAWRHRTAARRLFKYRIQTGVNLNLRYLDTATFVLIKNILTRGKRE